MSISGQALVFVVRTSSWSLISRAGMLTYVAFFAAQVIASELATCMPPRWPDGGTLCRGTPFEGMLG